MKQVAVSRQSMILVWFICDRCLPGSGTVLFWDISWFCFSVFSFKRGKVESVDSAISKGRLWTALFFLGHFSLYYNLNVAANLIYSFISPPMIYACAWLSLCQKESQVAQPIARWANNTRVLHSNPGWGNWWWSLISSYQSHSKGFTVALKSLWF